MASSLSVRRFWATNAVIAFLFIIIAYQFLQLTVIRRSALQDVANKQHKLTIEIPPLRGQILDRKGQELASNLKVPSIYAVPRIIPRDYAESLSQEMARILRMDSFYLFQKLTRDKSFVWIKRKVTEDEAAPIRKWHIPYIGMIEEYRRFYPQGDLMAQVLGFTDVDNVGLEGIELTLNKELQGRPGRRVTKRDALGREVRAFEEKTIPVIHGNKVSLTIDHYIQYLTERALERAYMQWKAKGAMAIVMEAKTGKILAIANRPSHNPNQAKSSSPESRRNRAITDMYEPGSVFKIVAASAALNENKVTPETVFFCENGKYNYGYKVLRDVHAYGNLSFEEVIIKSSNIGTVKIAAKLDPDVFNHYIELFGFGRATGIDLPGEAPGFVRPPQQWSKTSPYNIPMGHEIMVTPIQMMAAMAVVANGGTLVKPYIISKVEDQAGVLLKQNLPTIKHQVMRPEVAQTMQRILYRVVEEGTGKSARIPGIPVGGKTGTAQKVLPGGKGYSHSNFISSFYGFGPAEAPELVMGVVLDDPKPKYYGGTVAAPVFKEVMEAALISMGYIPKTAKPAEEFARTGLQENPPMLLPAQSSGKGVSTR